MFVQYRFLNFFQKFNFAWQRIYYFCTTPLTFVKIIMLFILFFISTLVLSGLSIKKATNIAKEEGLNDITQNFEIMNYSATDSKIPSEFTKKILSMDGIDSYNGSIYSVARIENAQKVKGTNSTELENNVKDVFSLSGNENTLIDTKFTNNVLKLVEGHINSSDNMILN